MERRKDFVYTYPARTMRVIVKWLGRSHPHPVAHLSAEFYLANRARSYGPSSFSRFGDWRNSQRTCRGEKWRILLPDG